MISILSSTLPSTTDGYGYGWQPLDGDMSKVRPVDRTVDFGFPEQFGAMWFRYGRWIAREHLPTLWRAISSSGKPVPRARLDPPDIESTHLADIVSQGFRDIVERFEPGIHQFEPFPIVHANGERDERPRYLMIAGQRVVISLDQTRTRPPMRQFPERPDLIKPDPAKPLHFFARGTSTTDWAPVFLREAVAGRHLFCTADFSGTLFVSADLRGALEEAGMRGATFLGPYAVTDDAATG
jgi:hypothetical protein